MSVKIIGIDDGDDTVHIVDQNIENVFWGWGNGCGAWLIFEVANGNGRGDAVDPFSAYIGDGSGHAEDCNYGAGFVDGRGCIDGDGCEDWQGDPEEIVCKMI